MPAPAKVFLFCLALLSSAQAQESQPLADEAKAELEKLDILVVGKRSGYVELMMIDGTGNNLRHITPKGAGPYISRPGLLTENPSLACRRTQTSAYYIFSTPTAATCGSSAKRQIGA